MGTAANPARKHRRLELHPRTLRILAFGFFCSTLVFAAALGWTWLELFRLRTSQAAEAAPPPPRVRAPEPVSPLLVDYKLDLPGRGEIFPALVGTGARDYWPLATLSVVNTSDRPVVQSITAEVPGWTRKMEDTLVLGPRENRVVRIMPELLPVALANQEMRRATLWVNVYNPETGTTYSQSHSVHLHSASDIYWGRRFGNAQTIARWVTPHDSAVLQLVSNARRHAPGSRMPGYAMSRPSRDALAAQVRAQARAVFMAMRETEIGYVSNVFVFGEHLGQAQRIRLPSETLRVRTANCMDVSVAFASAMENLGLRPVIVLIPGHAFVGVKLGPETQEVLYLDLTVLPKGTFEQAIARAQRYLKKTPEEKVLTIDIAAARVLGIYPMAPPPQPGEKKS